ncbi:MULTISPECIES: hypothetical protein [unclassified Leptolyngbya]|uniref:hypothetical protein n=1 Tax=unclassified Leptolyngbya TaxID=2650499 RepID=UPI00168604EB|nr:MULTISPECIES: hypothetical protein [unclassified Leptolyngbya]MBD1912600.1 hypothetical protein [Leptolyngbya sp. FACHB-8]MBD2158510.1 hypothetical protein [Leptolyngbya sp. FACHB-16]
MAQSNEVPRRRSAMPLLLGWLVANAVGGAIANILEIHVQFLGILVLTGIPIGFVQGFVLRSYMRQAWRWAVVTAIAWPLVNLLEVSLLQQPGDWLIQSLTATELLWEVFWLNLVRMAIILALLAVPQAWLLREQGGRIWVWIVASFVGGALLGAIGATTCLWWCPVLRGNVLGFVLGAASWLGYALVTGLALKQILDRR